jgi:hypothetical protein
MARNIFLPTGTTTQTVTQPVPTTPSSPNQSSEILSLALSWVFYVILFVLIIRIIRLAVEIFLSRKLVYIQVTLPRSDSKLDKEHETKKDFKEKAGIMNLVHNALWKIPSTSLRYTISNFLFHHIKLSYEIVYRE